VLAEYGNLSSATVLFVMKEFLAQPPPQAGERGLLAAFGPGFSMEMALLEWN
jgi:alkylresorcinol/alkylpyrone synthase